MPKVILVVDDDPSISEMLVHVFGSTYTVYTAASGASALEMLDRIPPPDVVITDLMMPDMDGIAFAQAIKADPSRRGVPIIFLTATTSPMQIIEAINAGARQVIAKPFKVQDLLDRVARLAG